MPFIVRRAVVDDAPRLLELRRTLDAETSFMLLEPGELTDTVEDERVRIARTNESPNGVLLVAEDEGRLVGLLRAAGGNARRMRHATHLALGVVKMHWGKGVASALLEEVLRWAQAAGLKRVELTTHTTNLRAIALYLRVGFQIEGVRRSSLVVDGAYVDEYVMSVVR